MKIWQHFYVSFMIRHTLILSEITIKSENPKIWSQQSEVLPNFARRNFNDHGIPR